MPSRGAIRAALHNFLGTYVSRYSEYDGYWLFGFLVREMDRLEFDLLHTSAFPPGSPQAEAATSAAKKFQEQARKAGVISWIANAHLGVTKLPGTQTIYPSGPQREGHPLQFTAVAVSDLGKTYQDERCVYVAPHDPTAERRSWGNVSDDPKSDVR
jgi:hypothetical protein